MVELGTSVLIFKTKPKNEKKKNTRTHYKNQAYKT